MPLLHAKSDEDVLGDVVLEYRLEPPLLWGAEH
jgi:hypothetical protein